MQTVSFKAGDTILTEGEQGDTAYMIVEGTVEIVIGQADKAKIVGTLTAGDVFGEMSLIEPGPRSATVRAVTDTECVATSFDEFMASIQENPARAALFMKTLVRRLRQMNERVASLDPGRRTLRQMLREMQRPAEPREVDPMSVMYWPWV